MFGSVWSLYVKNSIMEHFPKYVLIKYVFFKYVI